jgi:hypothetical protein
LRNSFRMGFSLPMETNENRPSGGMRFNTLGVPLFQ